MKKIAVLRCLRTSNNCTGSGCLKAFNNKTNAFAVYEAEETELAAFLNCSGCGDVQMPNNEEGLRKKLDRLVTIGVEAVHLSGCTKKKDAQGEKHECPVITKLPNTWSSRVLLLSEAHITKNKKLKSIDKFCRCFFIFIYEITAIS